LNKILILVILDDQTSASIDFPIDYFFPSTLSTPLSDKNTSDIIPDHKAHKYFEPPPTSNEKNEKPLTINEELLCSIPYENESDVLSVMQQSTIKISQANLSPPTFLQTTSTSLFSVVYTYSRTSSMISATLKFSDRPPNIILNKNEITLEQLIEVISKKLDEYQINSNNTSTKHIRIDVDALRGSLPLPMSITQHMVLVRPNSTDKQTALQVENLTDHNKNQQEQWFDTINDEYDMLECSICCETLTTNDAYQLLPCMYSFLKIHIS
jgi:hypothetical protein